MPLPGSSPSHRASSELHESHLAAVTKPQAAQRAEQTVTASVLEARGLRPRCGQPMCAGQALGEDQLQGTLLASDSSRLMTASEQASRDHLPVCACLNAHL